MRLSNFLLALLLSAPFAVFAQRQADWSVELTGNAQQIIFQNLTGIPIIQTEKAYVGVDPVAQKVAWTAERSAAKAVSAVIETGTDFYNMLLTPYVLVRNNLIDSRDGKIILDKEKESYKRVEDYEVIPALNSVLIRTTADGKLRLYLVNMTNNAVQWKADVMKSGGLAIKSESEAQAEEELNIDVPLYTTLVTKSNHLLYQHKKNLACIDGATGAVLWNEKPDPAEIFLSADGQTVYVVGATGGGLMAAALVGTGVKLKGNKIFAYNLLTGKSPWKDPIEAQENIRWVDAHPDFLTVVHKAGCNLYDYASGEKRWKKDFEARRITEILPNMEGYLITFYSGYKTMQLSAEGKELWKKPQIKETEDGETDVPEDGGLDRYAFTKGDVLIDAKTARFVPAKGSGMKRWKYDLDLSTRVAYDDSRKNIVILTKNKMLIVNPDKYNTAAVGMDVDFFNTAEFHTLELRDNSYFLTSQQEYVIVWPDENNKVAHKYYKKPFDGKGALLGAASAGLTLGAGAMAVSGLANAGTGMTKSTGSTIGMMPPGSGETELRRAGNQFGAAGAMYDAASLIPPARRDAFKQTRNFAYYFTKDKSGDDAEKVLVKVSKDSGAEADKLIFDDARPMYQVDEVQKAVYYAKKNVLKVFKM